MDDARHQFLADAALAQDEHGGTCGRGQLDLLEHLLHGRTLAEQGPDALPRAHLSAEQTHLAQGSALLEGLVDHHAEAPEVDGLGDVVVRALLHCGHRRLDRGVASQEDDRGRRQLLADPAEQFHAVHAGHDEIGNDEAGLVLERPFETFLAVGRLVDVVAPPSHQLSQAGPRVRVIIDNQEAALHRYSLHVGHRHPWQACMSPAMGARRARLAGTGNSAYLRAGARARG
jgi:hypothetical protein